jgi:hypothetical protein
MGFVSRVSHVQADGCEMGQRSDVKGIERSLSALCMMAYAILLTGCRRDVKARVWMDQETSEMQVGEWQQAFY